MVPMSWLARHPRKCSLFKLYQPFLVLSVFPAKSIAGCTVHYTIMLLKTNDEKHQHCILNLPQVFFY